MFQKLKKKYFKCIITKVNFFKSQLIIWPALIIDRAPVLVVDPGPASIIKNLTYVQIMGDLKYL